MKKIVISIILTLTGISIFGQTMDSLSNQANFQKKYQQGKVPFSGLQNHKIKHADMELLNNKPDTIELDSIIYGPTYTTAYWYNSQGNISAENDNIMGNISSIKYLYSGDQLIEIESGSTVSKYFYNSNGDDTLILSYDLAGDTSKYQYNYNSSKQIQTYIYSEKAAGASAYSQPTWTVVKDEYSYNTDGYLATDTKYFLNNTNKSWINSFTYIYSYNSDGTVASAIDSGWSQVDYTNGQMTDFSVTQIDYQFDSAENMTQALFYTKNADNSWSLSNQIVNSFTYLTEQYSDLVIPYWFSYSMEHSGEILSNLSLSYLSFKKPIDTEIVSGYTIKFCYSAFIATDAVKTTNINNEVSIYPNPTSSGVNINAINISPGYYVELYDIIGHKVLNENIKGNYLPLEGLENGMYIIKIKSNENDLIVKKLIIRK